MEFNKQYFLDKLRYDYSDLRDGQILFNEVFKVFPKECRQLVNSKYDCYFDDGKIEDFLTMIRLLVEKKEDIGITRPHTIYYSSREIDAEKESKDNIYKVILQDLDEFAKDQANIYGQWNEALFNKSNFHKKLFYRLGESMEKRKIREAKK